MATNIGDDDFDYDKPGAERSRRRRGDDDDDDLDSDLEEGDLLDDDILLSKKNPSELSDEELNDDLLQSDEEDQDMSGQGVALSFNATLGMGSSGFDDVYTGNAFEDMEGQTSFSHHAQYEDNEFQDQVEGLEYIADQSSEGYQDEVLNLDIDEPLEDEFHVNEYPTEYSEEQMGEQEVTEEAQEQDGSRVTEFTEVEYENAACNLDVDVKEESDEEEEDDEESGRLRFKTERKDDAVVRLSDASSKRRTIPETLELSTAAKADLQEFEEKERQRKQGRFGGRGRGGHYNDGGRGGMPGRGGMRGRGGPGGRGRDFPMFGRGGFRGDGAGDRGRVNEQRPPLQLNMGMQPQIRMTPPLQHHMHHSRMPSMRDSRGPGLFPDPGMPIVQQPLQLLMPPHPTHRPTGPRTHLSSPPRHSHAHPNQHQQHQPQQQHHHKNIHINPHFRGPSSSPVQVPSMPPVQNQPRPNITSQRLPAPPDFQQHHQGNFGPPLHSLVSQEQWRGPPQPHHNQDRFFPGEPPFPSPHMFDQPGPPALLNNSILGLSGQGPPSFPPQGALGGSGYGPMGLGQNQGPPSLSMQHPGPPGHPGSRGFVGHRQPFSPPHQGPPFSPPHIPYGVQSGLQQPMHHDPPPSHPPLMQQHHHPTHQQHRQDLPPQPLLHSQPPPQHHHHSRDQHMSPPNYCQPNQSGHRQMQSRPQGNTHRKNHTRPRMASTPLQQITPQRNSNLRELPIATSNNNSCQSVPSVPVVKAAQDTKQGLVAQSGPAGKGGPVAQRQGSGRTLQQLVKPGPAAQSSTTPQDPDEDEETRKYRLKIEEQKRLREEVLRRKELRRQQQAGERKKELLERIGAQHPNQTSHVQNSALHPAPQTPQPVPSLVSNGTPQDPSLNLVSPRPNVKTRLLTTKAQPPAAGWSGPQKQQITAPGANLQGLPPQRRNITPLNPQRQGAVQTNQLQAPGLNHPHPGAKRTVMQRISSMESPQVPQKIRLIKRQGEGDAGPNTGFLQPQQQAVGRASLQQRPGAMRKITVGTGGVQNQQAERGVGYQANRLLVRGRGRGRGRGVGRFGQQQNQRAPKIEPSTVSIEGLSTTTTNKQLMNLLNSIGPIETFKMLPDQRKAIAKFVDPQHALSFQHSFHRHMIDLSHIDVSIIGD